MRTVGRVPDRSRRVKASVSVFEDKGYLLTAAKSGKPRQGPVGGPRGAIKGWSAASRRRMREFLLTHTMPGRVVLGATLTIPGPVMPPREAQRLFLRVWRDRTRRLDWAIVWRLEVQKRGAFHWHCLVGARTSGETWDQLCTVVQCGPDGRRHRMTASAGAGTTAGRPAFTTERLYAAYMRAVVARAWLDALNALPSVACGRRMVKRGRWPGAEAHAADVQADGERGAWLRYLQDHATKAKQEQIAESVGRHWGYWPRAAFEEVGADLVHGLTDAEFFRMLRGLQRLVTPSLHDGRVPFGRRLGWRSKRGAWGKSVWFGNRETLERLVTWAKQAGANPSPSKQSVQAR